MAWSEAARRAAAEARKLQRMRVEFSAVHGRKVMKKVFHVRALDTYDATDKVAARIGQKKYDQLTNKVFKFRLPKPRISRGLARVLRGAGKEED